MPLLHIKCLEAKDLTATDPNGYSDPYVKFKIAKEKQKTPVYKKTLNPVYNCDFSFNLKDLKEPLKVEVLDHDTLSANDSIGEVLVDLNEVVANGGSVFQWFSLKKGGVVVDASFVSLLIVVDDTTDAKTYKKGDTGPFAEARSKLLFAKLVEHQTNYSRRLSTLASDLKEGKTSSAPGPYNIFVGTWNVGNAPPPDDLTEWVPRRDYDIVVFGAQECKYDPPKSEPSCEAAWGSVLQNQLGTDYYLVACQNMWQIRLYIFALLKHKSAINSCAKQKEATGIAQVLGNKGGVAISFNIMDLSLCFVNSHLAAHQHKVERRNQDVSEIISGTKMGFKSQTDVLNQYHHVFWMGDLNYRLDYGDQKEKTPSKEVFDDMVSKIEAKAYDDLFKTDQLAREMKQGKVFLGFQEGKYDFRPTFKVQRGSETGYKDQRSPAWCDRILWKSIMPIPDFTITQTGFGASDKITTSDHKPVWATFSVPRYSHPCGVDPLRGNCTIEITSMRGADLRAADLNGKSDPLVKFFAPFIEATKTPAKKKTLNPEWKEKEIPVIKCQVNSMVRLRSAFIKVIAIDKDVTSDEAIGYGILPLIDLATADTGTLVPFELPLTFGGLSAGRLTGHWRLKVEAGKFKI